jgi:hypothetical protein
LEQLASGSAGDGEHAGMGDAPLDRDGIEVFLDPVDRTHVPDLVPRLDLDDTQAIVDFVVKHTGLG